LSFPHALSGNPEVLILKKLILGAGLEPAPTGTLKSFGDDKNAL
jgi:hypothetical protein